MEIPYNGKVNPRLVCKRYHNTVFYYIESPNGCECKVVPCILECSYNSYFIRKFKDNFILDTSSLHCFNWENLFLHRDQAEKISRKRNKRIKTFRYMPYLSHKCIEEHFSELLKCENFINKLLDNFENYEGIDFCDVSAGGIQVRIHHKQIKGYTYGHQHTIKYDFSNIEDIPILVASEFIKIDKPEYISAELKFIKDGEKYGWD